MYFWGSREQWDPASFGRRFFWVLWVWERKGALRGKGGKRRRAEGSLGAPSQIRNCISLLSVEFGRRKGGQRPTLDAQRASNFYEGPSPTAPSLPFLNQPLTALIFANRIPLFCTKMAHVMRLDCRRLGGREVVRSLVLTALTHEKKGIKKISTFLLQACISTNVSPPSSSFLRSALVCLPGGHSGDDMRRNRLVAFGHCSGERER